MSENTSRDNAVRVFVAADRSAKAMERVRLLLDTNRLQIRQYEPLTLTTEALFARGSERSFGRMAHGFIAASDWLGAGKQLGDDEHAKLVATVSDILRAWQPAAKARVEMAFHDETTAQRAINLTAFRNDFKAHFDDDLEALWRPIIDNDLRLLMSRGFYAGLNNHGMFQNIALLVAADLYEFVEDADKMRQVAFKRLTEYFSTCFTADGIHIENNPTYHVMISRYLRQVVEYAKTHGEFEGLDSLNDVLVHAETYAAHAVAPNGMFPPVSDTAVMNLDTSGPRTTYSGQAFLGAVSGGKAGTTPDELAFVATESGYAIHRSAWHDADASFVFFSAAYNADYHKHSDELSLYVMNKGVELLREAGPYGYERTNPLTGYGFSSAAHNTLLVDGAGLPRTDGKRDETTLEELGSTGDSLHVRGTTTRFEGVRWSRELRVSSAGANEPILIEDHVEADDEHDFQFLWHFGPEVRALARGSVVELFDRGGTKLGELVWSGSPTAAIRLVSGQMKPTVQGWAFPKMGESVPATVLEVTTRGASVDIRWEFRTADFKIIDRGVRPTGSEWSKYQGEKPVTYLLDVPEGGADELLVVFTAIHQLWDFTYNYRASLEGSSAAKLFILDDFGDQGAYYLANGRDMAEFRSVQGLLRTVLDQLGVAPSDVTVIGSSKGGSGAILHGVTLGVAKVIAGAPQTKIGSFVFNPHPNVLEYVAGGTSEADIRWLDAAMSRALASGVRSTRIEILVGRSDHHYVRHVQPFTAEARSLGYRIQVMALPGTPDSKIGAAFRNYLESWVLAQEGGAVNAERTLPHTVVHDPDTGEIGAAVSLPWGWKASFKLLRNREVINAAPYSSSGSVFWPIDHAGNYRFRIYAKPPSGETIAFGSATVRV